MTPSPQADGVAPFTFVDLFSGAGGMSFGFKSHPSFRPLLAVDAQIGKPSQGFGTLGCNATYAANMGLMPHEADLRVYAPERILHDVGLRPGALDVLIACAPCTGFTRANSQNHLRDDDRNSLVGRVGAFVAALRPKILVMENARELLRGAFTHHFEGLRDDIARMGYNVFSEVATLTRFGLPQTRERALVVAVRDGGRVRTLTDLWEGLAPASASLTVRHAIGHLPPVSAGAAHPLDPMHRSPAFSGPTSLARIRAIPPDGGSWRDLLDHPDGTRLLTGSMRRLAEAREFGSHPDEYGRLWWDRPCVTIKRECAHVGNGRYAHPEQDRLATVRELALLNGFPAQYTFRGPLASQYRHLGDAVPPLISYQIAHLCHWMLTGRRPLRGEWCLGGSSLRPADVLVHGGENHYAPNPTNGSPG